MGVMNMLQDNGFYSVALVGEDKTVVGGDAMADAHPLRPYDHPRSTTRPTRRKQAARRFPIVGARVVVHALLGVLSLEEPSSSRSTRSTRTK